MTKVYIVRYGEYSDQGIAGVFSTKEKAQKYCDVHNEIEDYEDYWINDYELDGDELSEDTKVVTYYGCIIYLNNRISSDGTRYYHKKGDIDSEDMEEKRIYTKDVEIKVFSGVDWLQEYIEVWSVKGKEHAKKVALDKYYEILAEKEGVK